MKKLLLLFFITIFFTPLSFTKDFKGAEYRTKASFLYGRIEVRYKSANREGVLSSFFTYFDGTDSDPWEVSKWNEIDIEILGRYDNDVQFNPITPGQVNHVRHQIAGFNPHLDFHTYAIEWTPDYVAWFIEGEEVHRQTGEHIQALSKPQKIMMNIWNPVYEGWIGEWDPNVLPAFAFYDWVSYYEYTPGTGNYGSSNNFSHSWTDNFDEWDQERWQKATHTFGGNNCDFIPENAVFQDGRLILCLTNNTNLGYTDAQPPIVKWARASFDKIKVYFSEEVEKNSAENINNYIIPGLSVTSASLLPDQKTIELAAQNIDPNVNYNFISRDIKDLFGNTMSLRALLMNMPHPLEFPVKINCGGNASAGFLADQLWGPSTEYGYLDGGTTQYPSSLEIAGTENDQIFRDERWGAVKYFVRIPNGSYLLKLSFSENFYTENNARIFDIYVNGILMADNLDIFKSAGLNSAYELDFSGLQINSELLEIHLASEKGQPIINSIILQETTTGIDEGSIENPQELNLLQNYPNPFNSTTLIQYSVNKNDNLVFNVYDLLGKKVYSQNLGYKENGMYSFSWKARDNNGVPLSPGVYFYSLRGSVKSEVKKLILLN